jgi:ABC-type uncharacterized transport system fused permease/ATPase subunit
MESQYEFPLSIHVVIHCNDTFIVLSHFLSLVTSVVTQFLMNRISLTMFVLAMKEGAFRYLHGRIRTFCESVAFYRGEDKEKADTVKAFDEVYDASMYLSMLPKPHMPLYAFPTNLWLTTVGVLCYDDVIVIIVPIFEHRFHCVRLCMSLYFLEV